MDLQCLRSKKIECKNFNSQNTFIFENVCYEFQLHKKYKSMKIDELENICKLKNSTLASVFTGNALKNSEFFQSIIKFFSIENDLIFKFHYQLFQG